jgi:hypothetical protein
VIAREELAARVETAVHRWLPLGMPERSADSLVRGVVDALTSADGNGLLLAGGQVRRVKCLEHEFVDLDSDGHFDVWNFSTHREGEDQA